MHRGLGRYVLHVRLEMGHHHYDALGTRRAKAMGGYHFKVIRATVQYYFLQTTMNER